MNYLCFQVNGAFSNSTAQSRSDYTVIEDNFRAHIVKISRGVRSGAGPLYGYVIFPRLPVDLSSDTSENLDSVNEPIKSVFDQPSIVLAQRVGASSLAISVSVPYMKMRRYASRPSWCTRPRGGLDLRPSNSRELNANHEHCIASKREEVRIRVKCNFLTVSRIYVDGELKSYPNMNNNFYIRLNGDTIDFKNLENGLTTEVHLAEESASEST